MEQKKQESKFWLKVMGVLLIVVAIGCIAFMITGKGGFSAFFEDLADANLWLLIGSGIVLIGGIVILIIYSRQSEQTTKSNWETKEIVIAALCIALSFVLSYIKIWEMPMGGTITPASMLPVMLFAYIYGTGKGLLVSFIYALLQIIQGAEFLNLIQFLLDYILGFGVLGLAGLFKKSIVPGVILGGVLRFLCSFIAGFVFYGQYAPEGMSPILYSLGYNGTYMLPEIIICVVITLLPGMQRNIESLKAQNQAKQKVVAS
ncbi:MAG: energy-coupled thiamine transporter ThiT [Christensenellaceae bacterium]|jgi:thiamine transporter